MKRDHLEDLKAIVAVMKPNEIHTARKFITAFEGNATKGRNKSLMLFELILEKPQINIEDAHKKLSSWGQGQLSYKALTILIKRLQNKLPESMLLDVNISRKDVYGPWYRDDKTMRKRLIEANLLSAKGLYQLAREIYDDVIVIAEKYENYGCLIEALVAKQEILGFYVGKTEFDKYSE